MDFLKEAGRWMWDRMPGSAHRKPIPVEQWVMTRLPEEYRLAVWLHFCEGMTCSEVSDILSISEPGIRGRIRDGLRIFQAQLAKLGIAQPAGSVVHDLGHRPSLAPRRLLKTLQTIARISPNGIGEGMELNDLQ